MILYTWFIPFAREKLFCEFWQHCNKTNADRWSDLFEEGDRARFKQH